MTRRRYDWEGIARMARSSPGVWRQHRDLIAVGEHLYRHIRRRVPALEPTEHGRFRYRRANTTIDQLGRPLFDLKIMYVNEENP